MNFLARFNTKFYKTLLIILVFFIAYTLISWYIYKFLSQELFITGISYFFTKTVFWIALGFGLLKWWFGLKWKEASGLNIWTKNTILWVIIATYMSFWWVYLGILVDSISYKIDFSKLSLNYFYNNFFAYSFTEEFLFRGFLQSFFVLHFRPSLSIMIQSLLFVLIHLSWWFFAGVYSLDGVFQIFVLGLIWGFVRHKSKSLWPTVVAHGVYDFILGLIY